MAKKIIKDLAITGLTMGAGGAALAGLPANEIGPHVTRGFSKLSTSFPVVGKLAGAGLVFKASGRLIKTSTKLKGGINQMGKRKQTRVRGYLRKVHGKSKKVRIKPQLRKRPKKKK